MYGVEFNHQFQMYAAHGFVVLYSNPRGSTGYGEEFGRSFTRNIQAADYKDLMAGVDMMLAKGYIDPKRLAVTGGSGGGLLTAWIIGHTDRFAAAVSQYPVTNWITQAGTADLGYLFAALWMKSMPVGESQAVRGALAGFLRGELQDADYGDHRRGRPAHTDGESEELDFALKARRVPAVLVRIPDEPHGIRVAPQPPDREGGSHSGVDREVHEVGVSAPPRPWSLVPLLRRRLDRLFPLSRRRRAAPARKARAAPAPNRRQTPPDPCCAPGSRIGS